MKNLVIALVVVAVAFFVFKQFQQGSGSSPVTEQASKPAAAPPLVDSLRTNAAEGAEVFFVKPKNGSVVTSPLTVEFGITNMVLAPAGDKQPNSGHHHLLVDLLELPDLSLPLPANENLIHFGKAQTETTLELSPGEHTLQLLLGNYLHIPHSEPVISEKISVIVE